ncbi:MULTISPECIES: tyrosine-type recombinase/integrase [Bacteria]|uniref:tyrosine-type recombinase/integrase n=1 Tax=Bacteria TaxID=2 RepID=UPI00288920B6|nr:MULTISPECIES: tyrosine-type recombinase/integrase [unclassified Bacillus (in: firmicutes)]
MIPSVSIGLQFLLKSAKSPHFTRNKSGLHDLRHAMAALIIETGENMSAIQKRAGHASRRITADIYGHVTEKLENETAGFFDQYNPKLNAKSNEILVPNSSPIAF